MRIVSGIQPTHHLHLGNYLGAIKPWAESFEGAESFIFIADLHAITVPQDPLSVPSNVLGTAAAYMACGIDQPNHILFRQSYVPQHSELMWLLSCFTPLGWLNRMTQFKDKSGKNKDQACLGLYAYPVLMAADILLYQPTHVPVGEDQKQHLELARDIAGAVNHTYQQDIFVIPEPAIQKQGARIMSLRDGTKKMSKSELSDLSRIHLNDDPDTIVQKIRKAKTDALPVPTSLEECEGRPEALNLLTVFTTIAGIPMGKLFETYGGKSFSIFKQDLSDLLIAHFTPIRQRMAALLAQPKLLEDRLLEGEEKARSIAARSLFKVHQAIGLRP